MSTRQCPHCGQFVDSNLAQCPNCREILSAEPKGNFKGYRDKQGGPEIRKGLLWMLAGSILHYYLHGHDPFIQLPFAVHPYVVDYLVPFLFLLGAAFVITGIYRRLTN